MGATVKLRLGDMFEGPTDLIVIPCSTDPTITKFVRERLRRFEIPAPTEPMRLGEVRIQKFSGGESIAPFVAFAASVERRASQPSAIEEIGRELGAFTTREKSVREVTAPLLGAGAGGLDSDTVVEKLRDGFLETCSEAAQLRIYVLRRELFDKLQAGFDEVVPGGDAPGPVRGFEPARVFISYTHGGRDPGHADWVHALAEALRGNGIDARLDVWHRRHTDLVQWMTNELDQADRVLLVCNEAYAQKADRRHGGVGWEIRIVQGDMFAQSYLTDRDQQDKYVVVVTSDDPYKGLPSFLKTAYHIHWPGPVDDPDKMQTLVKQLFRAYEEAPPLGRPPAYVVGHKPRPS